MIDLHKVKMFAEGPRLEQPSTEETLTTSKNEDVDMSLNKAAAEEASTEPVSSGAPFSRCDHAEAECLSDGISLGAGKGAVDGAKVPKSWMDMAVKIRAAVKKKGTARNSGFVTPLPDPSVTQLPSSDYLLHITDEMREITEAVMKQGELTHNKAEISLNLFMKAVQDFNATDMERQRVDLAGILQRTYIVRKDDMCADLYLESLKPTEILRLKASERKYQRMMSSSLPIFRKFRTADELDQALPTSLAIELNGSMAMALSLLVGLFTSFFCGYFGGPYMGIENLLGRTILGLILTISFLVVEVSLILVRYTKLDRLHDMRKKLKDRRKEAARHKWTNTTTKEGKH